MHNLYGEKLINVINFKRKKMLLLTQNGLNLEQDATACYIYGNIFLKTFAKDQNYQKLRHHFRFIGKYRGPVHSISNLRGLMYLMKFLQFSTVGQTMIIILS